MLIEIYFIEIYLLVGLWFSLLFVQLLESV